MDCRDPFKSFYLRIGFRYLLVIPCMESQKTFKALEQIYQASPEIFLQKKDKYVIFSDLHMGNGRGNDDFKPNSQLFEYVLKNYYLEKDYNLILNGDVEELQRFDLAHIYQQWKGIYQLFDEFKRANRFYKIVGNHEIGLLSHEYEEGPYPLHQGLILNYKKHKIFIFHGHQASQKYNLQNALIGYTLRYIANPLGIKNYSVSHSSRKKYKIEKNVYDFSTRKKVVSIIGHTHRPLFESLPKFDRIKYKIEELCREYSARELNEDGRIKKVIGLLKNELTKIYDNENREYLFDPYLYNSVIHVPCLFNSGTVIGKRGITCLEISNGKIRLVHWFDKKISKKYLNHTGYEPQPMDHTDYFRMMINKEKLNYIFARIDLLA